MAIKSEHFSLIAFFRFTETYALRIQSVNPHFDEEKHKKYTTKTPQKSLINNDKKSRRWVFFFFFFKARLQKVSRHQGAKQIQYEGKRGDSMASENTEPLKKREGHNRIKLSLSSSKKHFYV